MKLLGDLRSNGIYHYYGIQGVFKGYKDGFQSPNNPLSDKACFSLDKKILKTRFYFSDVAASGYALKFKEEKVEYLLEELEDSLKTIAAAGIEYCCSRYTSA